MPEPTFNSYLLLSAVVLAIGLVGVFLHRTVVGVLLSVYVMSGGVTLAFIAGARYFGHPDGHVVGGLAAVAMLAQAAACTVVLTRTRHQRGAAPGKRHV